MTRLDLADSNVVRHVMERARHVATRRGHSELADDFAQEIFVSWLSGRGGHQTIDQAFIDYLRALYGRAGACGSGSGSGSGRFSEYRNYINLDEVRNIAGPSGDIEPSREYAHLFGGRNAYLYHARFVEEMSELAIAETLGVSESRVCQALKPIKKAIQDAAILAEARERMEWDEDYGLLTIDWIAI